MEKLIIEGGKPLSGKVEISGSKNASLPILAATLLTKEICEIQRVPNVLDVQYFLKILGSLGSRYTLQANTLEIQNEKILKAEAPYDLVRKMRASICLLAPLLARFKKADISLPGGCVIGDRPVNLHLEALRTMGAEIEIISGMIHASAKKGLQGAKIHLLNEYGKRSVLATANTIMAATLAKGITEIHSAACEPEITDLVLFLKKMGAKIEGEGTSFLQIEGVEELSGAKHKVIPDRIEAGTFLIIGALLGEIHISPVRKEDLNSIVEALKKIGYSVSFSKEGASIAPCEQKSPASFITDSFPGLPTDIQAQLITLLCLVKGTSFLEDTIFPERFMHCAELTRMGAKISVNHGKATIEGIENFQGASMTASDLRASAALLIAGLAAKGKTEIHRLYHIDRGYELIDQKLLQLGASIRREKV